MSNICTDCEVKAVGLATLHDSANIVADGLQVRFRQVEAELQVLDGSVIGGRRLQQTPHSRCVGGHDLVHCPVLPPFSVTGQEV
jgi:hypothetical protein